MKMKRKYPYQRGSKRNTNKDVVLIPIKGRIMKVPEGNLLLKTLEVEMYLWQVARDEEEALRIAELLVVESKPL
jgi:hypothetical protein